MKKALKYFAAILSATIFCLALAACGESAGTKYTFKETKATANTATEVGTGASAGMITALETTYNATYKDSTLEVKDGEIVWTIGDIENAMTYTMDGEKYVLAGDFTKQLSQGISSLGGGEISLYGQKTEEGFAIVMVETFTNNPVMTDVTFAFNFTAA